MGYYKTNRDFHEARWDEPIIMKLGNPGERGILVPKADEKVTKATGTVKTLLPKNLIRKKAPKLPEMSQMQVPPYLAEGTSTVGIDLKVKHMAATPVGMSVRAVGELVEIDGKRLLFTVKAFDDKEQIGSGTHERFIIAAEKFLQKAEAKKAD